MKQVIPTIDVSLLTDGNGPERKKIVSEILMACTQIGFLTIVGSGIRQTQIAAMRRTVQDIFSVSEASKRAQAITRANYRGYIPMGFFTPNDGAGAPDLYEGFKLHQETDPGHPILTQCPLYGPNRWPVEVPLSKEVVLDYWARLDAVTALLLDALADGLGLPKTVFRDAFVLPMTNMTLLHYPPQPPNRDGFGIHPHKDTDALTIIAPDPVGGLQVQTRTGDWIEPDCPPGALVVNIGDMLELWSGGRLVSTPHRVINASGRDRYSFPYFAVPRHDVVVSPALPPLPGFDRPNVHCGHWSAEIWRTNWPQEQAGPETPELGTLH
ncbi:MAG: 2OG-Fe(II) oxygenase family protein [Pseudomonadota bacterium]